MIGSSVFVSSVLMSRSELISLENTVVYAFSRTRPALCFRHSVNP
jgi:hypothetical protein